MSLTQHVGGRIRELRQSFAGRGISQEELAKEMKTTANTISRWETGTYKPSLEDLEGLSRFFAVSVLDFFPEKGRPADTRVNALLRAAQKLPEKDLEELRRYAEFRLARSFYEAKKRGASPRKRDANVE